MIVAAIIFCSAIAFLGSALLIVIVAGSDQQHQKFDAYIGNRILRQFRKIGAKRRKLADQSAKRQSELAAFWMNEMRRIHPTPANQSARITKIPPQFQRVSFKDNEVWR